MLTINRDRTPDMYFTYFVIQVLEFFFDAKKDPVFFEIRNQFELLSHFDFFSVVSH